MIFRWKSYLLLVFLTSLCTWINPQEALEKFKCSELLLGQYPFYRYGICCGFLCICVHQCSSGTDQCDLVLVSLTYLSIFSLTIICIDVEVQKLIRLLRQLLAVQIITPLKVIWSSQCNLSYLHQTVFSDRHNLNLHNEAMPAYLNSQMERK